MHWHVQDTVAILDDVNHPHTICAFCEIFSLWSSLNDRHPVTDMCTRGVEKKRRRIAAEVARSGVETAFQAYGQPLANVGLFKYLGCLPMATDYYWTPVVANLSNA